VKVLSDEINLCALLVTEILGSACVTCLRLDYSSHIRGVFSKSITYGRAYRI